MKKTKRGRKFRRQYLSKASANSAIRHAIEVYFRPLLRWLPDELSLTDKLRLVFNEDYRSVQVFKIRRQVRRWPGKHRDPDTGLFVRGTPKSRVIPQGYWALAVIDRRTPDFIPVEVFHSWKAQKSSIFVMTRAQLTRLLKEKVIAFSR